jgi:amidohydrolase
MNEFKDLAEKALPNMISMRRCLHENPEIDRSLTTTARLVCKELERLNISYNLYENCGIVAELGNNSITGVVALRADMDALEVFDLKDKPYKSKHNGYMHACGHDAHTSILLGAAAILKSKEASLKGRVRLIFQPAEETDGGAKDMIALGALKDVKGIIGLHVDELLNTGVIGLNSGAVYAASNPFKIIVQGKGSHGASPQDGVDAIHIAVKIIDNLQGIVSREISATDSSVVSVGKINGGTAINAICSQVIIEGILRTLGVPLRSFMKERIQKIVSGTAEIFRGTASVEFIESYPSFDNDIDMYEWFSKLIKSSDAVTLKKLDKPSMGVEDFAFYANKVPAVFYRLGCRNEEKGIIHPAHGSYFDIDEDCMLYGAMIQSYSAYDFLNKSFSSNF